MLSCHTFPQIQFVLTAPSLQDFCPSDSEEVLVVLFVPPYTVFSKSGAVFKLCVDEITVPTLSTLHFFFNECGKLLWSMWRNFNWNKTYQSRFLPFCSVYFKTSILVVLLALIVLFFTQDCVRWFPLKNIYDWKFSGELHVWWNKTWLDGCRSI